MAESLALVKARPRRRDPLVKLGGCCDGPCVRLRRRGAGRSGAERSGAGRGGAENDKRRRQSGAATRRQSAAVRREARERRDQRRLSPLVADLPQGCPPRPRTVRRRCGRTQTLAELRPSSSRSGALGTRIDRPSRRIGVGQAPRRTSSYAALLPTPRARAAVGRSTTAGSARNSSAVTVQSPTRRHFRQWHVDSSGTGCVTYSGVVETP